MPKAPSSRSDDKGLRTTLAFNWIRQETLLATRGDPSEPGRGMTYIKLGAERKVTYRSGGDSFVAVVQSANVRDLADPAQWWGLDRPADWCVLIQREVIP